MERAEVRALVSRAQQAVWHGPSSADVALDDVSEQITVEMQKLRGELARLERELLPLCPCAAPNPSSTDGPERDCPIHGDGTTFVGQVRALRQENADLRREIEARRASVTTGGPAPAFTSRPYYEGDPVQQVELPDCDCCGGDPRTVCDACGEHACWAGRFMCEDAQTAGTRQRDDDPGPDTIHPSDTY